MAAPASSHGAAPKLSTTSIATSADSQLVVETLLALMVLTTPRYEVVFRTILGLLDPRMARTVRTSSGTSHSPAIIPMHSIVTSG